MIVNKPQFDTDKIKPGQAYWLSKYNHKRFSTINAPCIVKKISPLSITVTYWNDSQDYMDDETIDIKYIVNNSYALEEMKLKSVN